MYLRIVISALILKEKEKKVHVGVTTSLELIGADFFMYV